MKKKIIGTGIAMLFAAGGALAESSVTLYGTLDAGVAYSHGTNASGVFGLPTGNKWSLESGQQSYSRVGFKGVEDLGSGLKAMFLLEQAVSIDTGNTGYNTIGNPVVDGFGTFSSQAYIGLQGGFGSVTMGRMFSPMYYAHDMIDPFKSGFAANINNFFGTDMNNIANYERMSNAIAYSTPDNLAGFKGMLAYGFGQVPGNTSQSSQIGLSLSYQNGPFAAVYAYHQQKAGFFSPLFDTFKTHFVGAAYDFGVLKLHGAFDQNKEGAAFKSQDYLVGVTVPFGPHAVFADYTHKKVKTANDANAHEYAVGYTYDFSKRTNLYGAYTYVKNQGASNIDTDLPGQKVGIFQVGVRHKF